MCPNNFLKIQNLKMIEKKFDQLKSENTLKEKSINKAPLR